MKFEEMQLHPKLIEAISYMGYENATPVQEMAIPLILANKDILACAQTGTGKTAAFVLPILNKLVDTESKKINTLILVPTRELAVQIEQQIQGISYFINATSLALYGGGDGKDWITQKEALKRGTDIIVATPGKLRSHIAMGYIDFSSLKHFVMDEADRMLDMGFIDDIKNIMSALPKQKQTLLFSATMPKEIEKLATEILNDHIEIKLALSKTADGVEQYVYPVYDNQKPKLLIHILSKLSNFESIIVFTSTKSAISPLVQILKQKQFSVAGISSDYSQQDRESVLEQFKARQIKILIATDVMSRGIDIKELDMVINYNVPQDAEDYVHRVGRTARANNEGKAITFVNPKDMHKLAKIEQLISLEIEKLGLPSEMGEPPKWGEEDNTPKKRHIRKAKWRKKA